MSPIAGSFQVKLTGLLARTRYYYRFVYAKGGKWFGSAPGRTQTAAGENDPSPVRFAFCSCEDAIGRYYNSYWSLLTQPLDFVAFIGDYIYETTGDPSFQNISGRGLTFTDTAGAIAQGSGAATYYAAASVSNYRELYRFYRSDPVLQSVHERFPFVQIWDDHEYSDDCWGATATYTNGLRNEFNVQRRRNAEHVFFEYIGIDDGSVVPGEIEPAAKPVYPDARIYRDFRFGANLHLLLTDYRSFRPDHLIPEGAFPGTVAVDRGALTLLLGASGVPYDAVKASFSPYLDLGAPPAGFAPLFAAYAQVLTGVLAGAYSQEGLAPADAQAKAVGNIHGKLDLQVVNAFLGIYNALRTTVTPVPLLDAAIVATLDRGISFAIMGKTALFSSRGARYFVVKATYDLYAAYRTLLLANPAAENAYGNAQYAWLESALRTSDARWKVVANSTSLTSMVLDLTGQTPNLPPGVAELLAQLPAQLRNRFYLNVDQFDGFPNFRKRLLDLYRDVGNVAMIAGDIHASFAAEHAGGTWEFTGPGVSSFAFRNGVESIVATDPTLSSIPGLGTLVSLLDGLLRAANPEIQYANPGVNGVVVIEAAASTLKATYWELDGKEAPVNYNSKPWLLLGKFKTKSFTVNRVALTERDPMAEDARLV